MSSNLPEFERASSPNRSFGLTSVRTQVCAAVPRLASELVFVAVFFLVFAPLGWIMRLAGRDPLRLKFEADAESYWIQRKPPGPNSKETMKDQF